MDARWWAENGATVVAGAMVALFAHKRYASPKAYLASTTQLRLHATGALYVLSSLLLFVVLAKLAAMPPVMAFLGGGTAVTGDASKLPAPLFAGLAMTTLLPTIPLLKEADARLLEWFQKLGHIPSEVRRLARELGEARLDITPGDLRQLAHFIEVSPLPSSLAREIRADEADGARLRMTRTLLLFKRITDLQAERAFRSFFGEFTDEWKEACGLVQEYAERSLAHLHAAAKWAPGDDSAEVEAARRRQKLDGVATYEALALFLARALLRSGWSRRFIEARVRAAGFSGDIVLAPPTPWNLVAQTALLFLVFFLCAGALISFTDAGRGVPPAAAVAFVVLTHVFAVFVGLQPKLHWAFARRHPGGERPYLGYLVSAACAYAGAFALMLLFVVLGLPVSPPGQSGTAGWGEWLLNPIPPMSAALGLLVAYLADDRFPEDWTPARIRVVEGLACGAALAVAALVVLLSRPETVYLSRGVTVLAITFAAGAMVGASVPSAYRRAIARAAVGEGTASPAVQPASPIGVT